MKKSRFTTEQRIAILQEHAAGASLVELLRRHSISRPTRSTCGRRSTGICR